jgi:adenylate kinase
LHIERVSPATLIRRGICRPQLNASRREAETLALLRHWFWSRKPDAGFLLCDFPATLLQAKVIDDWLDARQEALDAVLVASDAEAALVHHYRTLGLVDDVATAFTP